MTPLKGRTRLVGVMLGAALLGFYLWLGAFAWSMPFRDLVRPLRESGLLEPSDASADARMQEAFGGIVISVAALFCVPVGMMRRDWIRFVFLGWPFVSFLLPFATGYSRSAAFFWLSLFAGLTFPLGLGLFVELRRKA